MPERHHQLYLTDVVDPGRAIRSYAQGIAFEQFIAERMRCAAVIREFEICEAVGKLPEIVKAHFPEVSWSDIKNFRNLLAHEYFGVDLEIVWNAIKEELPPLPDATKTILSGEQTKEGSWNAL